ncbi:hypothetical protein DVH05_008709 [Phytophthora capsici]|nr:hypothetical protein DVH05_008709 [Phytophthora capsici]|eukprot:jgi/Phyca11/115786/e_gw1.29.499.1
MRVFSIFLLVAAATLVASASTESESKQRLDNSPAAPQWRTITENEVPTKRNLRKKKIEEERATTAISLFDDAVKAKGWQVLPYAELANLDATVRTQYLKLLVNNLERKQIVELTGQVPRYVLKHGDSKATRLVQYNKWIFNHFKEAVDPAWVLKNYPAFFKGYDKFYQNRFTRGYKYA